MKTKEIEDLKSRVNALSELVESGGQIDAVKKSLTELIEIVQQQFREKHVWGDWWDLQEKSWSREVKIRMMFHLGEDGIYKEYLSDAPIGKIIIPTKDFVGGIGSFEEIRILIDKLRAHINQLKEE